DGHNSHCTYRFCLYTEAAMIIILCLVAHTTHWAQPLDVGCFRPLGSAWKKEVMAASRQFIRITKYNLLELYDQARKRAFLPDTVTSAFRHTGIWP
ncbi:hypothetical protein ARMGADRAFT_881820, partial [Armillaria gallica]